MNMKKKKWYMLMFLFGVTFLVSVWQVFRIKQDYKAGINSYAELEQYISFENTIPVETQIKQPVIMQTEYMDSMGSVETTQKNCDDIIWLNVDFETLSTINSDIVGWLYLEGTEINYPIVQGPDNDFYLRHLFDKTYNNAGCIFLDAYSEADFTEKNNVIYGHHMKNGTMFYDLLKYKNQDFFDEHPYAFLITPTHRYKILFFAGYVSNTSSSAWDVDFSDAGYEEWLSELTCKSCFTSNISPTAEDYVVTLSTCSYEFSNARFVVHGLLRECS